MKRNRRRAWKPTTGRRGKPSGRGDGAAAVRGGDPKRATPPSTAAREPVGELDSQLIVVARAVATAYRDSADRHARFLAGELEPMQYAYHRAVEELSIGQPLAYLLFARVVAEFTVRTAWIARGYAATAEDYRRAIDSIERRDLALLRDAAKHWGESSEEVEALLASDRGANPSVLALAREGGSYGEHAYVLFRMASAQVHPGAGLRTVHADPQINTRRHLAGCMAVCIALAADTLSVLDPGTTRPSGVSEVLADRRFGADPMTIGLRLVRQLADGGPRPVLLDAGFHVRAGGGKEGVFGYSVEISAGEGPRRISAEAPDPESAYALLLESAGEIVGGAGRQLPDPTLDPNNP